MSILGYSSSYFLPEYWSNTPLYGEKLIPLIDYMLSTDYEESSKLAQAYYNMQNKYKNSLDLPIEQVKAIIEENGYSYIMKLLGNNEEKIRLLLSIVGVIHQLKGSKVGIELVLSLLKSDTSVLIFQVIGNPNITENKVISNISNSDFMILKGFMANTNNIELKLKFRVNELPNEQCIVSASDYGFNISIDSTGSLLLFLSSNRNTWNIAERVRSNKTIQINKEYIMKLIYDGYAYSLQISEDGVNYETWIEVESNSNLEIYNGSVYLGVNASEGTITNPLKGNINFSYFSLNLENIEVTQWFETFPMLEENTFVISTEVDMEFLSSTFFSDFANFVRNYVYPTLKAFTLKMTLKNELTFIPYAKQRMIYNAFSEV